MIYSIQETKKAYFDSFSGLIPVQPLRLIESKMLQSRYIRFKVLADFMAYKKGEVIVAHSDKIVPCKQIKRRKFGTTILTNFTWMDAEKEDAAYQIF